MGRRVARQHRWENIEGLVSGEGEITIGRIGPIRCAATATEEHNALAMLVRKPQETIEDLLTRLDEAIRRAVEEDEFTDEINP